MLRISHTTICIRPPPLAHMVVIEQILCRRVQRERVVGSAGVVLGEVVAKFAVELGDVIEQQGLVIIDELILLWCG